MLALQSPTEDRIDIDRWEDDLPPRSLPGFRPARFPEIAKGERKLYIDIRRVYRELVKHLWSVLRMQGSVGLAADPIPFELTAEMEANLDRAVGWYAKNVMGDVTDAEGFASPSNAYLDIKTPLHEGPPILPSHMRTAFAVGLERAQEITGAEDLALVGARNEAAIEDMMRTAFARLSDEGTAKIGDVLIAEGHRGGSVRDLLVEAMREGRSPLEVSRELRDKFRDIERYNWPRLARTETAFAQNHAIKAEYEAKGYRLPMRESGEAIEEPPFHPNCVCSTTIAPETGHILLDVAVTACQICQGHLSEQDVLLSDRERRQTR